MRAVKTGLLNLWDLLQLLDSISLDLGVDLIQHVHFPQTIFIDLLRGGNMGDRTEHVLEKVIIVLLGLKDPRLRLRLWSIGHAATRFHIFQ